MPELSIVTMQMCSDLAQHTTNIGGYVQQFIPNSRGEQLTCSCKGFQFRHTCKHIKQFNASRCCWHQQFDQPQTEEQAEQRICPSCGKKTVYVRVGV